MDEHRLQQIELSLDRQIIRLKHTIDSAKEDSVSYHLLKIRLSDLEKKLQQYLKKAGTH